VAAVESRSGVRGDVNRAHHSTVRRIERVQLVAGCKPDVPTIKSDTMNVVDIRKRSIFPDYFGC
jgi:hypothetical protein